MRLPKYPTTPHSSGQARISLNGKRIYLGPFGSPESYAKFHAEIARHLAESNRPYQPVEQNRNGSVDELLAPFLRWADDRYVKNGKPTKEVGAFLTALRPVHRLYGHIPANEFGPLALVHCRSELVKLGHCRNSINRNVSRIRQVFKWGVAREIVRPEVLVALQAVASLRRNEDGVQDRPKIPPAPIKDVLAIEHHVLKPVWGMIRLQLATGMRPCEVRIMRTCDISTNDPDLPDVASKLCWSYRPESHKTEHHGKQRVILLGPKAQEILAPWLKPNKPEAYLFSPRDGMKEMRARLYENAKFHKRNYTPKRKPKRVPSELYTTAAYNKAIRYACDHVGVPRWSANRLRKTAATEIRKHYGAEVARVILGHAHLSTTEIYADRDLESASKAVADLW